MKCDNKNVHLVIQNPLLGSIIAGFIETFEILIPMPKFEQELSTYICLSPAKMVDFMHPKWEGCIVINSLIFVVISRNIFVLPIFDQGLSTDRASIKFKKRMTDYIKEPHRTIFTGPTGCGKTHLVLDLIEKEYNKYFDYIIIICPTLRWNKTYHSKGWIKNDDKVWLIEPKDKLYQWIEKLSQLLAHSETLFIINDIIADESLDKRRRSLLELAISGRHLGHCLWLMT